MSDFQGATEAFLEGLDYIGELDSATLMAIRTAAEELDKDFRTTLLTEYRRQLDAIKDIGKSDDQEEDDDLLSPA